MGVSLAESASVGSGGAQGQHVVVSVTSSFGSKSLVVDDSGIMLWDAVAQRELRRVAWDG